MTTHLLLTLAASAGDEPVSVFAGTILQSIAAAVVFLILLAVLWKLAWGPILKGLQDREAKIKHDLEAAEKAARDASAKLKQLEAQLADAQVQAQKIVDNSRAAAQKAAAEIERETQTEVNAMRQRATGEIQYAKEQALAEIYTKAADLSTTLAGRILQREVKASDHQKLVESVLAEIKN